MNSPTLIAALLILLPFLNKSSASENTCTLSDCSGMAASLKKIEEKIAKMTPGLDYLGELPLYAATSCQQIDKLRPDAESGLYWIQVGSRPYRVYCDMNNTDCGGGVWTRVANVDMTTPSHKCPSGLETITSPKRSCRKTVQAGSSSTWFSTYEQHYSKICGKVIGYQKSTPDAFYPYHAHRNYAADNCYADGVLLSYNSPKQHIWTFAAMPDGFSKNLAHGCRCGSNIFQGTIPLFVGQDYFCETGVTSGSYVIYGQYHTENALWDGKGCGTFPNGCDGTRSPWFKKEFSYSINSNIELRICMNQNRADEDVLVEQIHIYIQ